MATELDDIVEAYEQARAAGSALALRRFLPAPESDSYLEAALELMRVDLEYSWRTDAPRRLEDYLAEHGDVLSDRVALAALAFEEFRLRRAAGQPVGREDYARGYGIDTSRWPEDPAPPCATAFPRVGERLFGFHLVRELGRGAFGRVYLAEQADLAHRQVAVKVTTELTAEPDRLAQLQHANIVPIYSLHRHEGLQVLCMPYYGDRTLANWLRDQRASASSPRTGAHETADARLDDTGSFGGEPSSARPPAVTPGAAAEAALLANSARLAEALRIMQGIAAGLAHAHRRGIVHRDLKPANVLLGDDGAPRVLDFNLATESRGADQRSEGVGGTLPYMSPEQLLSLESGERVDAASDVFACGVLLVEMVTGERPFAELSGQGRNHWRALRAQRLQGFPQFSKVARAASTDVASIARKCLAPEKTDRYRSAAELEEDLRRHLEHRPLRHAANRSFVERARKWSQRHPRLGSAASVATVCAALLIGAVVMILARGREVSRLDAVSAREAYLRSAPEIRAALSTPDLEPELVQQAVDDAHELLAPYVGDKSNDWRASDRVLRLDENQQQALTHHIDATLQALSAAVERLPASARRSISAASWFPAAETSGGHDPNFAMDELSQLREATWRRLSAREYNEAESAARRWVKLAPQDFEAQFLLGNSLVGQGRADEAEIRFSVCEALSPRSLWAVYSRGTCRLELGDWDGARHDFSRALALRPGLAAALLNRAIARERLGDTAGAVEDLSAAINTHQAPTRAYFMRSRLLARLGQSEQSKADHERGLALAPNDAQSWIARGMAQLSESPENAYRDFQAALQLNQGDANALRNSATVLASRLDRPNDAIAELTRLLALRPSDAGALAGRAVLFARQGRSEEALADVKQLATTNSTAVHCYQTACVYALLSDRHPDHRPAALRMLALACQQDAQLAELAPRDPDLAALHDDPEFRRLVAAAQALRTAGRNEGPVHP